MAALDSATSKAYRIFGGFEHFNLVLPVVFIVASILTASFSYQFSSSEQSLLVFLRMYVFFNATHIFFTFVFLLYLPEGRQLIGEAWNLKKHWFAGFAFLLFFLPLCAILPQLLTLSPLVLFALLFVPKLLFFRHSIGQNFGMSLLYNKEAMTKLSPKEKDRLLKFEKQERLYFKVFIILLVTYHFCKDIDFMRGMIHPGIWFVMLTITCTFIIAKIWNFPSKNLLYKKLYSVRLLLYPLTIVSPVAIAGAGAAHGAEYFFLMLSMTKKSSASGRNWARYLLPIMAYFIMVMMVFIYSKEFIPASLKEFTPQFSKVSSLALLALIFTIRHLHYYLDAIIFKISDPLVKESIGPLLHAKTTTSDSPISNAA